MALAGCTITSMASSGLVHAVTFILLFPLTVLVVTVRFGTGPAVFTAALGVIVYDYVYVPPWLAFALPDLKNGLTLSVMVLVAAVASSLAEQLRRQVKSARRQAEVESLRNALLSALSHDLRTPISTLVGASTALCEGNLEPVDQRELCLIVAAEAGRLNRLVTNLLELTRLQSGRVSVRLSPHAIEEVIGSSLRRLETELTGRPLHTDVPEATPFVPFDPVLIEQVLINLLENVARHTPAGSPIDILAKSESEALIVEVADRGPGVPPGDEELVFGKLYRSRGASHDGGVGLGLTICRAIVAAHDGQIDLRQRPGGGTIVRFALPLPLAGKDMRRRSAGLLPELDAR